MAACDLSASLGTGPITAENPTSVPSGTYSQFWAFRDTEQGSGFVAGTQDLDPGGGRKNLGGFHLA